MGTLFFVGDSITAGAWDEHGGWANRLIGEVMQKGIEAIATQQSFYCEPYNLGVSGNTVADVLLRLKNEISSRLGPNDKAAAAEIVFSIGVNDSAYFVDVDRPRFTDSEFRTNLENLVALSQKIVGRVSFIGILPVDDNLLNPIPWAPDRVYACTHAHRFERIIEDVCRANQLPFFGLYDRWVAISNYQQYLIDGVHPNTAGHALMAEQIGEFLFTPEFYQRHTQ